MPELPEVETIRRGLADNILKKNIATVKIRTSHLVRNDDDYFISSLKNQSFHQIGRVGKLLIFKLSDGQNWLLVHLKMTGQLIYQQGDKLVAGGHNWPIIDTLPNKYSHIIFDFTDGSRLFFNDMRQFGYLELVDQEGHKTARQKFGIEPGQADFTWQNFQNIFKNRRGLLKPLLLNQQLISGIGNIYADEICFRAKVRPDRLAYTLKEKEIRALFLATEYIIAKAIAKRGTTFSDYRDSNNEQGNFVRFLKVYGRHGKKCLRCRQTDIKKIKLGGRGTHYCPHCQK